MADKPRDRDAVPHRKPWKWLRQIRQERGAGGIIPAIGSGWNAQAVGTVFGWRDLLEEIRKATRLTFHLPPPELTTGNTTLIWERMLFDLAWQTGQPPHQVESKLQTVVARTLRKFYPVGGVTDAFARRFLALGFEDVLSFNFDQGLHAEESAWHQPKPLHPVTNHCRVTGATRVWYPHGTVCDPPSIQLGLRAYSTLINDLELARQEYKASEKELFGERASTPRKSLPPRPMADQWRVWGKQRARAASWVASAMNAPLVFAGLSLGREEWPLWWFLNQRARNHARRNLSWEIPTFAILIRKEAEALATAADLVNITLLPVDSYQEAWDRMFETLS
ncbi:MAG TPA: hypothetical protein VFA20_31965 [Myxococcaceae bacterium]|nr:hypothetical protein [Myxococcaceae bacterium]